MAVFEPERRQATFKVVYFGPSLAGKVTNLKRLSEMAPPRDRGRLLSLRSRRTTSLFFDLLTLRFALPQQPSIKVRLFTVPDKDVHRSTRRVILRGSDAAIFVAHSEVDGTSANQTAYRDLKSCIQECGLSDDFPIAIQFNKQDMPYTRSAESIAAFGRRVSTPTVAASAKSGAGVFDTLKAALIIAWQYAEEQSQKPANFPMHFQDFRHTLETAWSHQNTGSHAATF